MIYFAVWNVFVAAVYGLDKLKAKAKKRRISERTLLLLAFFMGAVGAFFGVFFLNNKNRKPKFVIGVPFLVVLNIAVIWFFRKEFGGI